MTQNIIVFSVLAILILSLSLSSEGMDESKGQSDGPPSSMNGDFYYE